MSAIADATESIDRTVTIFREFPSSVASVYSAFTDTQALARWMKPKNLTVVESLEEVDKDGRFQAILRDRGGTRHLLRGVFREVVPNRRLVFTWEPEWHGRPCAATIVTVDFIRRGDRTALKLTHSVFATLEERDRHARYWARCLDRLADLLV